MEKTKDLSTLFINFHHILNEYRPHQSRESLMQRLQDRIDDVRNQTGAIHTQIDNTRRVIEGLASIKIPDVPTDLPAHYPDDDDALELDWDARDAELYQLADDVL